MKLAYLSLSLPLVACYGGERATTGQCPAGEVCSPTTPYGLHFIGNGLADDILLSGPAATAIGGTQDVALQYDRGDGVLIALDQPYTADDDGGIGVKVDHTSGSVVTMRGVGSRTNYLRILDPGGDLMDRKELTGAAIDAIALVPTDFELVPSGVDLAWATGEQSIGVALSGQVQESGGPTEERLVDTSMQLALAGADRAAWDTLHLANATTGTSSLQISAGDKPPLGIDVVVVDHADAITPQDPAPASLMTNETVSVCFSAMTGGRYVVGLGWTYVIDGVTLDAPGLGRNCASVSTTKTSGTVSVQALAGGQTATVSLSVGATRQAPQHRGSVIRPTAGDRAAM